MFSMRCMSGHLQAYLHKLCLNFRLPWYWALCCIDVNSVGLMQSASCANHLLISICDECQCDPGVPCNPLTFTSTIHAWSGVHFTKTEWAQNRAKGSYYCEPSYHYELTFRMCISQNYELINYEPVGLIIFMSTMVVLILLLVAHKLKQKCIFVAYFEWILTSISI